MDVRANQGFDVVRGKPGFFVNLDYSDLECYVGHRSILQKDSRDYLNGEGPKRGRLSVPGQSAALAAKESRTGNLTLLPFNVSDARPGQAVPRVLSSL